MYCKNCGTALEETDRFCPDCGRPADETVEHASTVPEAVKKKSGRNLTAVIAVLMVCVLAVGGVVAWLISNNDKTDKETTASVQDNSTAADQAEEYIHITEDEDTSVTKTSAKDEKTTEATSADETEKPTQRPVETTNAEREPGSVKITPALQYDVNVFLSNFSEAGLESFEGRPSFYELEKFGEYYNFFNRYEKTVEFSEDDGYFINGEYCGNYRIKAEHFISAVKKYFGSTVGDDFADKCKERVDGYFYGEFTGAHHSSGFSIVSGLNYIGDGIYEAEFEIYESGGNDSPYYVYTSKEIRNYVSSKGDDVYLREAGNGTAKFKASDLSDRSTYKLIGYNVNKE